MKTNQPIAESHLPHIAFLDAHGAKGAIDLVIELEHFEQDIIWVNAQVKQDPFVLSLDDRLEQLKALSYARELMLEIVKTSL